VCERRKVKPTIRSVAKSEQTPEDLMRLLCNAKRAAEIQFEAVAFAWLPGGCGATFAPWRNDDEKFDRRDVKVGGVLCSAAFSGAGELLELGIGSCPFACGARPFFALALRVRESRRWLRRKGQFASSREWHGNAALTLCVSPLFAPPRSAMTLHTFLFGAQL
jgi:hypothetical protein